MTIHHPHHHLQAGPIDPRRLMMIHQIGLGSTDLHHHLISAHTLPPLHDHLLTEMIPMGSDLCHHQSVGIVHVNQKVEYSAVHCSMLHVCVAVAKVIQASFITGPFRERREYFKELIIELCFVTLIN